MVACKVLCFALAIFCAVSAAPQERITGGSPTDISEFPYIAALVYHYPRIDLYIQRCVGPIISSWHVLATAFCFTGAELPNFVIRAGSTDSLSGGIETTMRGLLKHPDYVESPRQNDIALVFLQEPLRLSNVIRTLPLPPQYYEIPDGTTGLVAGWGFEKEPSQGGSQHESLKTVTLQKVSQEICAAAYSDVTNIKIDDNVFCATKEDSGVCFGDAGAPMAATIYTQQTLIGISSSYKDCGSTEYPDVFTRVDRFTNWIMENAVAPSRDARDGPVVAQ